MSFNKHELKDKGLDGVIKRVQLDCELYRADPLESLNWLMIATDVMQYEALLPRFHIMNLHRPIKKERWKPGKKLMSFEELNAIPEGNLEMAFDFKVSRLIYRLTARSKDRDLFTITAHALARNDRFVYLGGPDAKSIREATENALFDIERLIFKGHG